MSPLTGAEHRRIQNDARSADEPGVENGLFIRAPDPLRIDG